MKTEPMLIITAEIATHSKIIFPEGMIEKLSRNSTWPVVGDIGKLIFSKNKNP